MGGAKKEQMEHEEKTQLAIGLCIKVGAIEECEVHPGAYIDSMAFADPDELTALILAKNPEAIEHFNGQNEMTDCVHDALALAGDECGYCVKIRDS